MNYEDFIIEKTATVADAMEKLQAKGQRILFVAPSNRLEAVVTDGDIRRYILSNRDLNVGVMCAAKPNPVFTAGYHEELARNVVEEKDITCCPMVDWTGLFTRSFFATSPYTASARRFLFPLSLWQAGLEQGLSPIPKFFRSRSFPSEA